MEANQPETAAITGFKVFFKAWRYTTYRVKPLGIGGFDVFLLQHRSFPNVPIEQ